MQTLLIVLLLLWLFGLFNGIGGNLVHMILVVWFALLVIHVFDVWERRE